jgi:hypothetical protein
VAACLVYDVPLATLNVKDFADFVDHEAELDAYLADLDAELGPIPQQESVAAREWADQVLPARSGGADAACTA